MNDLALKKMTVAEFLEQDVETDTRYELIDGFTVAMSPPSDNHGVVVVNLSAAFKNRLQPPCRARAEAGILRPGRNDTFFQADLAITCKRTDGRQAFLPEPLIIVEVLSPSTIEHDRGTKVLVYREIKSVEEVALVSLDRRHVEIWHRNGQDWLVQDLIGDATVEFRSVGVAIPLAEIYEGIDYSEPADQDQPQ